MRIAIEYAIDKAKAGLECFRNIPKAWYANERFADAIAGTSTENKKFVDLLESTIQMKN